MRFQMRFKMLEKRSLSLSGHRTSIALEPAFWAALQTLANTQGQTLTQLITVVDAARTPGELLASALRVYALHNYRSGEK